MENYKINGRFLARKNYKLTDTETKQPKEMFGYDLLVYDGTDENGMIKARVVTINVTADKKIAIADSLKPLEAVLVEFGLNYQKDGTYKPKYIGFVKS